MNDDAKNSFEQERFIFSPSFLMDIKAVKECQDGRAIPRNKGMEALRFKDSSNYPLIHTETINDH